MILANSQPFGIHRREKYKTIRDLNRLSNSQLFGSGKHRENNNWKRILYFQRIQNLLYFFLFLFIFWATKQRLVKAVIIEKRRLREERLTIQDS
jgi:hypothetical protein